MYIALEFYYGRFRAGTKYEPFKSKDYDVRLIVSIHDGLREEIIDGTPVEYNNLYTGNNGQYFQLKKNKFVYSLFRMLETRTTCASKYAKSCFNS